MSSNVAYKKDAGKKETEKCHDVKYDCTGEEQHYAAVKHKKKIEDHCRVKYSNGCDLTTTASSSTIRCTVPEKKSASRCSSAIGTRKSDDGGGGGGVCRKRSSSCSKISKRKSCRRSAVTSINCVSSGGKLGRKLAPTEVAEKCYEVKRDQSFEPCGTVVWQRGKYCRDDCGSGIVPRRLDIKTDKRIWCKTPLSMYQATIGELGKQMLCRETIIQRDIRPGPPCNVCEDILPPCRGYYRKYDCIRPCEEDHTYKKRGQKHYRSRTERYWEPCLTVEQKHRLNINEYGPQNAALTLKLRRERWGIPCW